MLLFMDGFDHYGLGGQLNMLDGLYAAVGTGGTGCNKPSWGPARTGQYCFVADAVNGEVRWPLPAPRANLIVGHGYAVSNLPGSNFGASIMTFSNGNNEPIATLQLGSTGALLLFDTNQATVVQTSGPVIVAQNWHFLEYELDTGAQTFRLDVDGVTVINASGLNLPNPPNPDNSQTIAQVTFGHKQNSSGTEQDFDDLTFRDPTGAHNNGFEGDLRVATLFPSSDGPDQGWTPQYRKLIGNGILSLIDGNGIADPAMAYMSASSTVTDLGAGDFTLEQFVRFNVLPTGANKSHIIGKWFENPNRRSYQLYLGGPTLDGGNLAFRTSTDGTAGTIDVPLSWPWVPDLNTWYHVAVVRASGELLLFIDGIQQGVPVANTTVPFVGSALLSLGCQAEGSSNVADTGLLGWMDEARVTVGAARYTSNFTPTTVPFPRGSGDADWNDVGLLCGFDGGSITDESQFGQPMQGRTGAFAETPDDGSAAFQTLDHHTPQDDTFIQAALLAAASILTLNSNPVNGDFVTTGHYTSAGSHAAVYTFKAALAGAFDILIGANITASLNNLQAAINKAGGEGVTYGTGTIVNDDVFASALPGPQMTVTALAAGTAGNSIASTSTFTDGASGWNDTTLDGGADIPGDSDFFFDRPPPNTVLVKAVQITSRSFKTDAGAGSVQASFIGPLGTAAAGADNNLTVSPTYRIDIFEEDPDTSGNITPSTIVSGRVRLNRTS